jgi:hypothetical protein
MRFLDPLPIEEVQVIQHGQVFKLKRRARMGNRCARTAAGSRGAARRGHRSAVLRLALTHSRHWRRCLSGLGLAVVRRR